MGEVMALGTSFRSTGASVCFYWRVSRGSSLDLTKEQFPDKICMMPLILKSHSFWFTSVFMFLTGSLWGWLVVSGRCFRLRKAVRS